MKYTATVGGQTFEVEITQSGQVALAGEPCSVDLVSIDGLSLFSVIVNNRSYEVFVERSGGHYYITIEGQRHIVRVDDERTRLLAQVGPGERPSRAEVAVEAPMPGLVVAVPVEVGQEVEMGQGVVILEAMKMENELRAPRGGRVKAVRVGQGQTVDRGEVLVVIE